MANEWTEHKLTELYDIRSGLSKPRKEFGFGYGFLSFKDVLDNYFVPDTLSGLVNSTPAERESCSVQQGDVFLTRTSETMEDLGMSCVALRDYPEATFNGFTKRLRPKTDLVVPEYAAYFFRGPRFRQAVTAMSSPSTRASLNNEMIGRLSISLPPRGIQERIGTILKSLDDKIELNRRTNETLEAMTRRLFRSWFVDFDPVRAKATVRAEHPNWSKAKVSRAALPTLAPEIAELFPDGFENSTLGPIPKGWAAGSIGDIGDNPRRGAKPDEIDPGTPYIALEHMPRRCIALSDWGHADDVVSGKFRFKKGEILFGKLRPYFHKVGIPTIDGVCSTDVLVIVPNESHWFSVLLGHVSSDEMIAHTDSSSTGTKMPRTNWGEIARFEIAVPTTEIATLATQQVAKLVDRIHANIYESRNLARARDRLIPRLLSGDLFDT